jgi:hypothetical protein
MRNIFAFIAIILTNAAYGQHILDSNSFEYKCNYDYKIEFKIQKEFEIFNHERAFIPTYFTWSCMPYFFKEAIINKKRPNNYVIYFDFDATARSTNEAYWITKKYFNHNYDVNTNYLGGSNCQIERERDLINVFVSEDFKKFNADTILCIRVDSNAREKNDPQVNDFMYVVMHKQNICDIYVCFAYKKEYEFEIMDEIKNLWQTIKFRD